MPPTAETDPQSRTGFVVGTAFVVTSAAIIFPGNALAQPNGVDVEKAAFNAHKNTPTRTLDSFSAPASVAMSQVVENPGLASASSNETLIPGPNGLVSAGASSSEIPAGVSLRDFCIDSILDMPEALKLEVRNPGKVSGQSFFGRFNYEPVSQPCLDAGYSRYAQGRAQKQNPKNRDQWMRLRNSWTWMFLPGESHNEGGVQFFVEGSTGHEDPSYYLRNGEQAQVQIRHKVRNANNKVIAQRVQPFRAKVIGRYQKGKRGR